VHQAAFDRSPHDREPDDRREHLGKERENVDVQHDRVSFFARLFGMAQAPAQPTRYDAGVAALERQRFAEALTHFGAALGEAATPAQRALVHNKRALTFLRQGGAAAAALEALCDALDADPRCVPAIVNVGNLLLEDGVLDDAITHYEAALRIDDGYAAAHLNVGIAYKRLGRRGDAVRAFRRANRLDARSRG
jgi:protein O-GlcNAc transferase